MRKFVTNVLFGSSIFFMVFGSMPSIQFSPSWAVFDVGVKLHARCPDGSIPRTGGGGSYY